MRLLLLFALLLSAAGCSKPKPAAGDATAEFWTWFTAHSAEYARLLSYEAAAAAPEDAKRQMAVEQAVADTATRLRRIHAEFSPFFGSSEGTNKLIITVGGQKEFFPAVDRLVATAPTIAGWTFIALKPPVKPGAATEIRSGSATFKLGELRYSRQPHGDGSFDFTMFVPSEVSSDPEGFQRLCTRLLEEALGERTAAGAVHGVEVRQLDSTTQDALLEFIDVRHEIAGD